MTRRSRRSPTKFLMYFHLLDAFREAGCPVCSLLARGAQRALDGLMYEQVNDPITRDRLVESHGFCNWHAWMLPRIANSGLGTAIIYQHLLQVAREVLEEARQDAAAGRRALGRRDRFFGTHGAPSPFPEWRRKKTPCFLCGLSHQSERDALTVILDYIGEPEFAEAFARSAGLCLSHLGLAAELGQTHPHLPELLDAQALLWRDLHWELGECTRKADYRYADEAKGREGTSWIRALSLFVGQPGLFGPERERMAPSRPTDIAETPPTVAEPLAADAHGAADSIEQLRFENERLKRHVDDLVTKQEDDRKIRLALEFQVCKLTGDLKALPLGVEAVDVSEKPLVVSMLVGAAAGDRPPRQGGDSQR